MSRILFMLVKFDEEKESIYLCSSSDWTVVTKAENEEMAASQSVNHLIKEWGLDINVAPAVRIKKIEEKLENSDSLLRMDKVLSDVGLHKESKALREIFQDDRD